MTSGALKTPVGKGGRLIVYHVELDRTGSKLVFVAKNKQTCSKTGS